LVPLNVIVAVPLAPALKLRPPMPDSDSVPFVLLICTCTVAASGSATLMALPLPLENTSAVFCGVACAPGTVFTGGSFTAVMLIGREMLPVLAPPEPVLPRSFAVSVSVSLAGGASLAMM
jgi:hypothetical protein